VNDEWLEVRSTTSGLLHSLGKLASAPPSGAKRTEGVLNVVVQESRRPRRLPALYFGTGLLFADREVEAVVKRARRTVSALLASQNEATFSLHAFEIDGRRGLYARDVFNRSPYRRRLMRLGVVFADDPYTTLTPRGTFKCEDWGEFTPDFMVFGYEDEDPSQVLVTKGAMVPMTAIDLRIGPVTPEQLHLLIDALRSTEALSAGDSQALVAALRKASN
jgi:hypothetical protein